MDCFVLCVLRHGGQFWKLQRIKARINPWMSGLRRMSYESWDRKSRSWTSWCIPQRRSARTRIDSKCTAKVSPRTSFFPSILEIFISRFHLIRATSTLIAVTRNVNALSASRVEYKNKERCSLRQVMIDHYSSYLYHDEIVEFIGKMRSSTVSSVLIFL